MMYYSIYEAAAEFFGGDAAARDAVEAEADGLVDRWLLWLLAETADPPPTVRLDFLVSRTAGLWTCEARKEQE